MNFRTVIFIIFLGLVGGFLGYYLSQNLLFKQGFISPLVEKSKSNRDLPLQVYSIKNLQKQNFPARHPITVREIITKDKQIMSFQFIYHSQGKNISGVLNVASPISTRAQNQILELPVIVMLRGWVPVENYVSGLGTKNAAQAFAQAGYLTLAPDFLGYGQSDSDLSDTWEARFIKPINVIDLLNALAAYPEIIIPEELDSDLEKIVVKNQQVGIWAHSNGGQIAISTLQILKRNIPSTLWAPVTAPFPYSIIFYSHHHEDEGKDMRKYLSIFERDYDVFDFSINHHLDSLQGPLQIHHGAQDQEAPIAWSDEFVKKLEAENLRRSQLTSDELTEDIDYTYYRYKEADHNLRPNWQTAINRDIDFFNRHVKLNN